jgi:hypothetical protein
MLLAANPGWRRRLLLLLLLLLLLGALMFLCT